MKFLIFGDPTEVLKPAGDSSLTMVREALARGHEVYWATSNGFRLEHAQVWAHARRILRCAEKNLPELAPESFIAPVRSFAGVWIRKDPPFDSHYVSMCWLLALEEAYVPIVNRPSLLLRYHEKLLPFEAQRLGFLEMSELLPTYAASGTELLSRPQLAAGPIVTKPWFGFGGHDVERWESLDAVLDSNFSPEEPFTIFQNFVPTLRTAGDRRVVFIEGEFAGTLLRIPATDSIRSNLAQGGQAVARPLNAHEQDLCLRLGQFLKKIGISLAGVDIIDGHVTEINITSPTGFASIAQLGQAHPRVAYLDLAEKMAQAHDKQP